MLRTVSKIWFLLSEALHGMVNASTDFTTSNAIFLSFFIVTLFSQYGLMVKNMHSESVDLRSKVASTIN